MRFLAITSAIFMINRSFFRGITADQSTMIGLKHHNKLFKKLLNYCKKNGTM
jgi:hypothetical protein